MDAASKKLGDDVAIAFNEMAIIGKEVKAAHEHLKFVDRDSERYTELKQNHLRLQAKWDAAYGKFLDADARRIEALKSS